MSRSKDRARAESGLIFRNGEFVNKEEWKKAHPSPDMKRHTQAEVDKAIKDMRAAEEANLLVKDGEVLDPKDTDAVLAEETHIKEGGV